MSDSVCLSAFIHSDQASAAVLSVSRVDLKYTENWEQFIWAGFVSLWNFIGIGVSQLR